MEDVLLIPHFSEGDPSTCISSAAMSNEDSGQTTQGSGATELLQEQTWAVRQCLAPFLALVLLLCMLSVIRPYLLLSKIYITHI